MAKSSCTSTRAPHLVYTKKREVERDRKGNGESCLCLVASNLLDGVAADLFETLLFGLAVALGPALELVFSGSVDSQRVLPVLSEVVLAPLASRHAVDEEVVDGLEGFASRLSNVGPHKDTGERAKTAVDVTNLELFNVSEEEDQSM